MRTGSRQTGASFYFWLLFIGILALLIAVGIKLFPIYMEYYSVVSVLEQIAQDSKYDKQSPIQIWSALQKRFSINNIRTISKDDVTVKRKKGRTYITVEYEIRINLVGNLDGVAVFEKTIPIARSNE